MNKFLLALHVLAAIVTVGPVTVAASMYPPAVRRADADTTDAAPASTVRVLHRICRIYAGVGITVPLFGLAVAASMGVLGSGWLITSIALTAAAAAVLVAFVLPRQDELLEHLTGLTGHTGHHHIDRSHTAQLAMFTGVFNLLWLVVTILMIVRPGSTTGA